MPLYQYRCEKCGEQFDVRQKFVDAPLTVHEVCGGKVERMLSAPALQFKGTGFYITDYSKNNSAAAGNNGGAKKPDTAAKETSSSETSSKTPATSTTTESKPASTSDTK